MSASWLHDWHMEDALSFAGKDRDESNAEGTNFDDKPFALFHFKSHKQTLFCQFCKGLVSAAQAIYAHTEEAVERLIGHYCGNFWCNEFFQNQYH